MLLLKNKFTYIIEIIIVKYIWYIYDTEVIRIDKNNFLFEFIKSSMGSTTVFILEHLIPDHVLAALRAECDTNYTRIVSRQGDDEQERSCSIGGI